MPSEVPTALAFSRSSNSQDEWLFEHAPEAEILIDPYADRLLMANSAARQLLTLQPDDVQRTRPSEIFSECLVALTVFSQAVLELGRSWTDCLRCKSRTGRVFYAECHAVRIEIESDQAILVMIRDAEQQRLRGEAAQANEFVRRGLAEWQRVEQLFAEIERENQLILQAAGEGIYGLNAEGITTFVNQAGARMLGYEPSELVGKGMHALVHHSHPDGTPYPVRECPIYAAFKDGTVHQIEDEVFQRKDGTAFPVEYTSTPIRQQGKLAGAVVVFRDVSDRKQAEEKLRNALQELESLRQRLEQENAYLQEELSVECAHHEIVGRSQVLHQLIRKIEMVAPTEATVLITGESGTGKELIARAIHHGSERSDRPLIRVNCASVPAELFESEFFGHVKGAFTGALRNRTGRFDLADGGTLFLDEVGDIPLELQSKLLRVLQEGQFEPVGSEHTKQVDVRIIAATNRDLKEEAAQGRFREDLYFRLNVFPIVSVPLRERREDIPLLASHFLSAAGRRFGRSGLRMSKAQASQLQAYNWPGNVRELENVIERAAIISGDGKLRIELPDIEPNSAPALPLQSAPESDKLLTEDAKRQRDRDMILRALHQAGGKVAGAGGAAQLLGLKPTTLASRIKRWGIVYRPENFRQ